MTAKVQHDTDRLNFLLGWLDHNEDVRELPVRDWTDHYDARLAIDEAMAKVPSQGHSE